MRIEQLLELVQTNVSHEKRDRLHDTSYKGEKGAGYYSAVDSDPEDPHMVKKRSINPMQSDEHDAYRFFIDQLIDNDFINRNPYFPRVYDVKGMTDDQGRHANEYRMEELIPHRDVSEEELLSMMDRIFNDTDIKSRWDDYTSKINSEGGAFRDIPSLDKIQLRITHNIENAIYRGDFSNIKDETMVEAGKMLNTIMDNADTDGDKQLMLDFNKDNIMYRRGKYGLQPVITDPFN